MAVVIAALRVGALGEGGKVGAAIVLATSHPAQRAANSKFKSKRKSKRKSKTNVDRLGKC